MDRIKTILGIWLVGYILGFIGYFTYEYFTALPVALKQLIVPLFLSIDKEIVQASITGLATSLVFLGIVTVWANRNKKRTMLNY
tara:strand:+ start:430 stop:681 length:252 start_codon:yes stop_codon:yes gene_type:complete